MSLVKELVTTKKIKEHHQESLIALNNQHQHLV
jgi:hypothetical protein